MRFKSVPQMMLFALTAPVWVPLAIFLDYRQKKREEREAEAYFRAAALIFDAAKESLDRTTARLEDLNRKLRSNEGSK